MAKSNNKGQMVNELFQYDWHIDAQLDKLLFNILKAICQATYAYQYGQAPPPGYKTTIKVMEAFGNWLDHCQQQPYNLEPGHWVPSRLIYQLQEIRHLIEAQHG